jgi:quercetin dioxygenase-like cupin family protein
MAMTTAASLEGWDIGHAEAHEWVPWGEHGNARAKVLANGDGYMVVLVEAERGYVGTPHEHTHTEFSYVVDGELRNQGETMRAGDAFAAAAGSMHSDFEALTPATYVSIFKL